MPWRSLRLLWAARVGLGGADVAAPDQGAFPPPARVAVAPGNQGAAVVPVARQMLGADPWRASGDSVDVLVAFHVHAVPQRAAPTGLIRLDLDGGLPPLLHLRRLRDHQHPGRAGDLSHGPADIAVQLGVEGAVLLGHGIRPPRILQRGARTDHDPLGPLSPRLVGPALAD